MTLKKSTIQWELMLPEEFRTAFEALPVCFLPLGTVEWHGEHDALGLDSLKAHALCIRPVDTKCRHHSKNYIGLNSL